MKLGPDTEKKKTLKLQDKKLKLLFDPKVILLASATQVKKHFNELEEQWPKRNSVELRHLHHELQTENNQFNVIRYSSYVILHTRFSFRIRKFCKKGETKRSLESLRKKYTYYDRRV